MDTSVISVTGRTPLNEVAMLSQKLGPCYLEIKQEGRSQDGRGIGRGESTFSSTNSLKEQQNGEQSLQNNF